MTYAQGETHYNWSANPSYQAIHKWLRKNKQRTGICQICGARPIWLMSGRIGTEFANISGEYRRDVDDYIELCRPCHRIYDA